MDYCMSSPAEDQEYIKRLEARVKELESLAENREEAWDKLASGLEAEGAKRQGIRHREEASTPDLEKLARELGERTGPPMGTDERIKLSYTTLQRAVAEVEAEMGYWQRSRDAWQHQVGGLTAQLAERESWLTKYCYDSLDDVANELRQRQDATDTLTAQLAEKEEQLEHDRGVLAVVQNNREELRAQLAAAKEVLAKLLDLLARYTFLFKYDSEYIEAKKFLADNKKPAEKVKTTQQKER